MERIFEGRKNRLVMIGLFLGMLELIRNRLIWAEQPESNGPILVKPLTSEPAEEAVQKAIYADHAEEEEPLMQDETGDQQHTAPEVFLSDQEDCDDLDDAAREELSQIKDVEIDIAEFSTEPQNAIPDKPAKGRIPIVGIGPSAGQAGTPESNTGAVEKMKFDRSVESL